LKSAGQVDQLEDVNFVAALDLLCEQGHWQKCLERAKKNEGLLHHYAGRYVYHLLKQKLPIDAMHVYIQNGVPANKHHYPLYRGISEMIFMDPRLDSFENWMNLRNLLFQLIGSITETPDCGGHSHVEFEHFLIIVHYYCNRSAFNEVPGLEILATKCSVALLRHCDVIPVDRAFYEAGIACKRIGWDSMAFVFLNHYLDIHDAMEEGVTSTDMLDNSDIKNTDIPLNAPMPSRICVPEDAHDEVKEWVLAASMDRSIAQELRLDERGLYEASLLNPHQQRIEDACLVTGYPALGSRVTFRVPNKVANKEDWNKLFMTAKSSSNAKLTDILEFITRWCGSNPNYSL
jgi:intraflagellar transport protein 172